MNKHIIKRGRGPYAGRYLLALYELEPPENCVYVFGSSEELGEELGIGKKSPRTLVCNSLKRDAKMWVHGRWLKLIAVPLFEEDIEEGTTLIEFRRKWKEWFGDRPMYVDVDGNIHREYKRSKGNKSLGPLRTLGKRGAYRRYDDYIVTDCKVTERIHIWLRKP